MNGDTEQLSLKARSERLRSMVAYAEDAFNFVSRASSQLPTDESDIHILCRLWTLADEYDVTICESLAKFDSVLTEPAGELDITRSVEAWPSANSGAPDDLIPDNLVYVCSWEMLRSQGRSVTVRMSIDRASGEPSVEVADSGGRRQRVPFPDGMNDELLDAMELAFLDIGIEASIANFRQKLQQGIPL